VKRRNERICDAYDEESIRVIEIKINLLFLEKERY
jgi:hypothetical protein